MFHTLIVDAHQNNLTEAVLTSTNVPAVRYRVLTAISLRVDHSKIHKNMRVL